ncbi:ATP-dependent DNA ligase [Ensifer adhaerens]
MPRRVEPCVATLVDKPPKGPEWAFEVKWDGYRLAVHVEPGEVRAITRGGYDWTKKFGAIVAEARELVHAPMIIDGEAVVLDDQGRSDFGLLQRAVGKKPSLHEPNEIIFYAFDLLYLDAICASCRCRSVDNCSNRLSPAAPARYASPRRCTPTAPNSSAPRASSGSKA